MASKLKTPSKQSVVLAIVYLDGHIDGGHFNHGRIALHTGEAADSYNRVLNLSFQRHRLDTNGGLSYDRFEPRSEKVKEDLPPYRWDFGDVPMGRFYGGHVDMDNALDVGYGGVNRLLTVAHLIKKVQAAIKEYNIEAVTRDEMDQWVQALEKLGVRVDVRMRWQMTSVGGIYELPEAKRSPSAKYYNLLLQQEREKGQPAPAVQ